MSCTMTQSPTSKCTARKRATSRHLQSIILGKVVWLTGLLAIVPKEFGRLALSMRGLLGLFEDACGLGTQRIDAEPALIRAHRPYKGACPHAISGDEHIYFSIQITQIYAFLHTDIMQKDRSSYRACDMLSSTSRKAFGQSDHSTPGHPRWCPA